MKKKTLALVLAFTMTAALFTGCGSKNETETTQTQTETAAETESEEVDDQAAADEVAALIDAIYVQTRNENTDEQCAAAKAAWDKLTDAQKELVEGENADPDYFGRDTGDASKDDPLNEDGIGENELLVVSFGTSFNDSRAEDIGGVEKALQEANPDWSVRRAFTAQIIINHVQARDGEKIDNVEQALDRAVENGVKNLVVQPTHLMHGAEYDELVEALDEKDNLARLILKLYDEYAEEIKKHMKYEEKFLFPYVESLLDKQPLPNYDIDTFSKHHGQTDQKLRELKNIIIKYLPSDGLRNNQLSATLCDIYNNEEWLAKHSDVEEEIMIPAIRTLEKKLKQNDVSAKISSMINTNPGNQDALSEREKEVIVSLVQGMTNKEIANHLCIAPNTVITHRRNIARKLQIHTPAGLTIYAIVTNLVDISSVEI